MINAKVMFWIVSTIRDKKSEFGDGADKDEIQEGVWKKDLIVPICQINAILKQLVNNKKVELRNGKYWMVEG